MPFQLFTQITWSALLDHGLFAAGLFCLSVCITWLMQKRVRIMDSPNERSSHTEPTPKSGGIAIVATFMAGILAIYLLGDRTPIAQWYFIGFILSALLIALVSFYDDINYKSFSMKLGSQMIAATVVLAFGLVIDVLTVPWTAQIHFGWLAYPITFLWIVGLTNSFNFMDGLDGLAGGVAVIVSFFFGIITLSQGSTFVYITCYAILSGSLGFLLFNFSPARIFMGDVGSAFLGFVFATIAIIAGLYDHSHTSFLVMPLLLFNFIFDTGFTFIRRLFKGEYVTQAHRTHLYQLCNQLGASHRTVSLSQYAMCIAQGLGALYMVNIPGEPRLLVFLPFLAFQVVYAWIIVGKARRQGILV